MKSLEKFTPKNEGKSESPKAHAVPHQYPPQIQVLKGLPLVYSRDVMEDAEKERLLRVPYKKRFAPLTHEELDWLEAFLGVCQYMAKMSEE